ncbi:MAG TPA: helix-turn-helix domain-containing protein [Nocardioidaceae bacterium]|nr:helix-turn-helix domain-containing protein [Nocardioidaceae bacterium]
MGAPYRQFCPVAKAMELLDERWTMLIVRELICGSEHFNEIRRGVPRISPTLLAKRLQQLTRAGIITRVSAPGDPRYCLTDAGRELRTVVEALGSWGIRWVGELGEPDLDPKLLLWDMHRNVDWQAVPNARTVVKFVFPDVAPQLRSWWLVIASGDADVCDSDPEYPVEVTLVAPLRLMTRIWRGDLSWSAALRAGDMTLQGPAGSRRALPSWFTLSTFAAVTRP